MLSDPEFISLVKASYEKNLFCIEYILDEKVNEFANQLKGANDEYLSARADDILDVYGKVLDRLIGIKISSFDNIPSHSILVSESLNPSDAILLSKYSIKALVLHQGGKNSHLSILARTYSIPLVFGINNVINILETGETVIVDGNDARIIVNPDEDTIKNYQSILQTQTNRKKELSAFVSKKALSKDGTQLSFYANIGSVEDAKLALENGATGIGLFRTEFLFMDNATKSRSIIDEEEQVKTYKEVLQIMQDKPVTIRTLDAGGDKIIDATGMPSDIEKNPLLGLRAIRFCLNRTDIFKTQLRALYRASIYGNLKIMIPLITTVEQLQQTKQLITEVQNELTRNNISFKKDVPLGIMIETPSASVIADILAQDCDFFSIGTNDLTQYMLCVDRENEAVAKLFQELNPAVLRQIQYTFNSGQAASIPVSVCGEMASRPLTLLPLLGIGITTFSMSPTKISEAKEFVSQFDYTTIQALAKKTALCSTSAEVESLVARCISTNSAN
jgi:phosphotransferase system enzyme I (PtsI)